MPRLSADIQQFFDAAAIRCCNVEAPLRGHGAPVSKTGPDVDQDPKSAAWLQEMGFNLFAMANNHIHDYGDEGLLATQQAFGVSNVMGIGTEDEAYAMLIKEVDGIRYGFLAYGENGYGALNGDREIGYAWINHARVQDDIAQHKTQVDILIIQVHGGVEMLDVPIPEWKQRYKELIDFGADIIVGHHPHVVQGVETYRDKLICYSLGNFCFDYLSNHPQWNIGGLLQIEVSEGKIVQHKLHITEKTSNEIKLWESNRAAQKIQELSDKLNGSAYITYVNREVLHLWRAHHVKYYAKAVNGITDYSLISILKHIKRLLSRRKVDHNMIWHNLFIESNLWLVQRAIGQIKDKR
jgi:poly-gamma-glutamate synthesis protein (capsule biosynthesis protein)